MRRHGIAWAALVATVMAGLTRPAPAAEPVPAASPAASPAAPHVTLRSGEHPGFGRLVFDLPPGVGAKLRRLGGRLTVRLSAPTPIDRDQRRPRNVRAIALSPGRAELTVAAGARIRHMQLGHRLVIDVLDPARVAPGARVARVSRLHIPPAVPRPAGRHVVPVAAPPAMAAPAAPPAPLPPDAIIEPAGDPSGLVLIPDIPPARAVPVVAAPLPAAPAPSPAPVAAVPAVAATAAPVTPVVQAALSDSVPAGPPATDVSLGPIGLAAAPAPMPGGAPGRAMALPFAADTAAAAFRQGGTAVLVFDRSRPIDMAPMKDDPVFGAGAIQLLPGATVLRLPLAAAAVLRLARTDAGWTVAAYRSAAAAPPVQSIRPVSTKGALVLAANAPGAVVSVPDPATGGLLLVGTQHAAGQALAVRRRTPQFSLLAGFQGVALRPIADAITLRATPQGFMIGAGPGGSLVLSPQTPATEAAADASRFSRLFNFPDRDRLALRRRLIAAIDAAAATPAQARGPARLAVARAMIALGMGPEAQAVLQLAVHDDPRLAASPVQRGLAAIAALLARRPAEAAALDDPALAGYDDITLWRAFRTALAAPGAAAAAPMFAAEAALPLAFPRPLRDHVLPLMAETMARGGERDAARRVLAAHPANPRLDYARGLLAEADAKATGGDPHAALAIYDRLAGGADRRDHARAAVRAVELRLARLGMPPAQGADALEALLDAWRGGPRELALRRRIAALREAAGQWRPALAMLRRASVVFPAQRAALHDLLIADFARAVAADV